MTNPKEAMKLEQQVVSLELAKRLKELGVRQESLFKWYKPSEDRIGIAYSQKIEEDDISAFTVAELGEIMKGRGMGVTAFSGLVDSQAGWWVRGGEWIVEKQQYSHLVHAEEKWADALAKMLIYLIENNLLNP